MWGLIIRDLKTTQDKTDWFSIIQASQPKNDSTGSQGL
jgi:hypothetical protein